MKNRILILVLAVQLALAAGGLAYAQLYGGFTGNAPITVTCAGQATLASASPSTVVVTSSCFTAATNVVLCTDNTSTAGTAAIDCVPAAGTLTIYGPNTVTDKVSWARVL